MIYNTWGQNMRKTAENYARSWKNTLKCDNLLATFLHHPTLTCTGMFFSFLGIFFWSPNYHCMVFSFKMSHLEAQSNEDWRSYSWFSKICCLPLKFGKNPCSPEKLKYFLNFIMQQFFYTTPLKYRGHVVSRYI